MKIVYAYTKTHTCMCAQVADILIYSIILTLSYTYIYTYADTHLLLFNLGYSITTMILVYISVSNWIDIKLSSLLLFCVDSYALQYPHTHRICFFGSFYCRKIIEKKNCEGDNHICVEDTFGHVEIKSIQSKEKFNHSCWVPPIVSNIMSVSICFLSIPSQHHYIHFALLNFVANFN